ncbi:uncharacterized protein [Clytia hemisphaerica]|uniref:Tryptophan synthase beta chain-like PALP domain-containing protein n=1 Tax=Clytia hemisphaerica TaxID=252671 RepID=A0A7M5X532_9CNID|eukprot:TCONS_00005550-protein
MAATKRALSLLRTYNVPGWASKIRCAPKDYVELARKGTPIHRWELPGVPDSFELSIKRDDLTGYDGCKIRKLEFIFAEALEQKSTCVITCGSLNSNHCRATAVACKRLGLDCHLLLRSHDQEGDSKKLTSNLLLNRLHGANCYMVPYESLDGGLNARLEKLSKELSKQGERPFIIPLGGSNSVGTFGILNAFQELIEQGVFSDFDDIVLATSSGGTLAGMAIANYLTGEKLRVHGICVSDNSDYFYEHIAKSLEAYHIRATKTRQICDIMDGYKGEGYAKITPEDQDTLVEICQTTGVLLDSVYTVKAVKGMVTEMNDNPKRFKGNRVLFLHTGGTYGIFDGSILQSKRLTENNAKVWKDIDELTL